MPIPIPQALAEQADSARVKAGHTRRPLGYLISSMLAGAYIGVAVVLMVTAAGPLNAAGSPWTKLVQGMVFGIALTLVIFAGSELSTGNMMTMVLGLFDRARGVGLVPVAAVIVFSFLGNLVGSVVFAWLVHMSGVLAIATAGQAPAGATFLAVLFHAKSSEPFATMFFRGVLCNFLVCLGVWMAARTRSDGAKLVTVFWVLLAFICTGFDHVVANMTIFSLAMLAGLPHATVAVFATNMVGVGLGNLVGGGLLVGAAYGYLGRNPGEPDIAPSTERTPNEHSTLATATLS